MIDQFEFPLLRMLAAFCLGFVMCRNGQYSQLLTKNQLSSTSTLGVDGIGLFLVMVTYLLTFFASIEAFYRVGFLILFLGILILSFIISGFLKIKYFDHKLPQRMILFGLSLNLLVGSLLSIMHFLLIAFNFQFPAELWFGSLKFSSEAKVLCLLGMAIVMQIFHMVRRRNFLVFNFNLKVLPKSLGKVSGVIRESFFLITFSSGLIILLFGLFPFLSLILPILIRELPGIKGSLIKELKWGAIISGIFIMLIDLLSYNFPLFSMELPLGMLSSVLGSFLLLFYLVSSQENKRW